MKLSGANTSTFRLICSGFDTIFSSKYLLCTAKKENYLYCGTFASINAVLDFEAGWRFQSQPRRSQELSSDPGSMKMDKVGTHKVLCQLKRAKKAVLLNTAH